MQNKITLLSPSGLIHLSDEIGKNYLCGMGSGEATNAEPTCNRCLYIARSKEVIDKGDTVLYNDEHWLVDNVWLDNKFRFKYDLENYDPVRGTCKAFCIPRGRLIKVKTNKTKK